MQREGPAPPTPHRPQFSARERRVLVEAAEIVEDHGYDLLDFVLAVVDAIENTESNFSKKKEYSYE